MIIGLRGTCKRTFVGQSPNEWTVVPQFLSTIRNEVLSSILAFGPKVIVRDLQTQL